MKKRRVGTEKAARAVLAVVVPSRASLLGNLSGILFYYEYAWVARVARVARVCNRASNTVIGLAKRR